VEQAYPLVNLQAASGALIANFHRELTGEGQQVDVSMQESIVIALFHTLPSWDLNKTIVTRIGPSIVRAGSTRKTDCFPCKDGFIAWEINTGQQGSFTQGIVQMMDEDLFVHGLKDLNWAEADMDNVTQEQIDEYEAAFARYFLTHTKEELYEKSIRQRNILSPVNNTADILDDRQLEARDFWVDVEYPELDGPVRHPGCPFKINGASIRAQRRAPLIGEHNQEILRGELGFSQEELCILRKAGAI
jgi:benzylsuccinate CoA-transferase BbsE subunit